MFKRLLIALGLRAAPAPIRSFAVASSFVGALPALAYVAWKYRSQIGSVVQRARHGNLLKAAQPTTQTA